MRVANLEEWYVNPLCIKPPATRQPFGTEDCGAKTIKREVLEVDIIDIYFTQKTLLHAMCGCRSCRAVCTSINLKGGRTVDPAPVRRSMRLATSSTFVCDPLLQPKTLASSGIAWSTLSASKATQTSHRRRTCSTEGLFIICEDNMRTVRGCERRSDILAINL